MIELLLIGIGTGNPEHLTRQAVRELNRADVVLLPHKGAGKADLAELRQALCDEVLTNAATRVVGFEMPRRRSEGDDYLQQVDEWHAAIAATWQAHIAAALPAGEGCVALLVWGDPSLYDSSLRIAERLRARIDLCVSVVPGITAVQALTAAHAIAVNDIGQPFTVTTGRQLREQGWPPGVDTVVVMLDGDCAFQHLPPDGLHIWWGAYLGMPQQCILQGPLATWRTRIPEARAAARAEHGWIMDVYLLRRQNPACVRVE